MRDPNRIYPLIMKVHELWTLMPDARLGQVISYIESLPPVNNGSRLMSTTHLVIEDHIWTQFIDEAIAKIKEKDYNMQEKEREYIDESSKRQSPSSN